MLYDIDKSFTHHWQHGFLFDTVPEKPIIPPQSFTSTIFGHTVSSRIGVSACPLTVSQGISILARMGYGIFTYKTIRCKAAEAHREPNICYVPSENLFTEKDINVPHIGTSQRPAGTFGLANSFGNACPEPERVYQDIKTARSALSDRQMLIVSVYGSGNTEKIVCEEYAHAALLAQEAGADAIECNISCPNIPGDPPAYTDPDQAYAVIKAVTQKIFLPVIVKIGYCKEHLLKDIIIASARAGAQGICSMNTLAVQVVHADRQPYFGPHRAICGVSGNPIRNLALTMTREIHSVIEKEKLSLILFGTGGITLPEHIDQFFSAGADVAMSATGAMLNPYLAQHYFKENRYEQTIVQR